MSNRTSFRVEKISPRAGIELGPLDQAGTDKTEKENLVSRARLFKTNDVVS